MLRWAVTSCLILSPLFIHCAPQSGRYETEQEYTDAPEPVSSYHEAHTEKATTNRAFAKTQNKPQQRPRFHEQQPSEQPYQSQEQYQRYQSDYRTSAQPQSTQTPAAQYEHQQQDQYQAQHLSQAKYAQQHAAHDEHRSEHRPSSTTFIPIIRLEKTQALDGSYQQSWETGNNIIASENGYLKRIGDDQDALVQTGNYSYTAPDGTFVWNSYISDESGFRVIGSHLPTPPPVPEEIQRGLDQIYEGIRLQQEAAAREAKSGKKKPTLDEDNTVGTENDQQSDNYPPQYRYQQKQQPQAQPQPQQYEQPHPQQQQQQQQQPQPQQQQQQRQVKQPYRQQPQQQYQNQDQPQTFRPIVAQPYRRVQKVQRPQNQQYQQAQYSQQYQESQRIQPDQQQPSQSEEQQ